MQNICSYTVQYSIVYHNSLQQYSIGGGEKKSGCGSIGVYQGKYSRVYVYIQYSIEYDSRLQQYSIGGGDRRVGAAPVPAHVSASSQHQSCPTLQTHTKYNLLKCHHIIPRSFNLDAELFLPFFLVRSKSTQINSNQG